MGKIEFGLALDFGTERAPLGQVLEEYVPLIQLAERHGFNSVGAGQAFPTTAASFHVPSPFLELAALIPHTKMKLATGVTLMPGWHPLNLAYDGAMLDQLSGGRLVIGISVANPGDWQRFGIDRAQAGQRFDELLQAVKALWAGGDGFEGKLLRAPGPIWPLPIQAGGPPLLIGGLARVSVRRAAALGDGWYAATQYHLSDIRRQVEAYKEELRSLGKQAERPTVAINRLGFVAESRDEAFRQGGEYVRAVLRRYASFGAIKATENGALVSLGAGDPRLLERALEGTALVGTPTSVAEQLETYADAGVTQVQLRVAPGDMPANLVAQTITLMGERVLPRFA